MSSKYELPFSTGYVADWTYIEAFRELFQNALDNEITAPENLMGFSYTDDTIKISNKTSVLELDSLLLGSSTKADDNNTIGRHGEGYKIAFLVLLREGKTVTVYNYGKREVWTSKLVKSKRYNNQLVPVITVDKAAFWQTIPDNDLTIEIGNISQDEYEAIVAKNLNLQTGVECVDVAHYGKILTSPSEKGNLYVKGLYICNDTEVEYGYSFEPGLITLDRDRRLIQSFDLCWNTSAMWKVAYAQKDLRKELLNMVMKEARDVRYLKDNSAYGRLANDFELSLANDIATKFVRTYGTKAIPVRNNDELQAAKGSNPVMVNETVAKYLAMSDIELEELPEEPKVWHKLQTFFETLDLTSEDTRIAALLVEEVKDLEQ